MSESGTSGSQVTGDQNVPAGKVTLFTLEGAPTLGSYDGFEHGPDGAPLPDRPIGAERNNIYAFFCTSMLNIVAQYPSTAPAVRR